MNKDNEKLNEIYILFLICMAIAGIFATIGMIVILTLK